MNPVKLQQSAGEERITASSATVSWPYFTSGENHSNVQSTSALRNVPGCIIDEVLLVHPVSTGFSAETQSEQVAQQARQPRAKSSWDSMRWSRGCVDLWWPRVSYKDELKQANGRSHCSLSGPDWNKGFRLWTRDGSLSFSYNEALVGLKSAYWRGSPWSTGPLCVQQRHVRLLQILRGTKKYGNGHFRIYFQIYHSPR